MAEGRLELPTHGYARQCSKQLRRICAHTRKVLTYLSYLIYTYMAISAKCHGFSYFRCSMFAPILKHYTFLQNFMAFGSCFHNLLLHCPKFRFFRYKTVKFKCYALKSRIYLRFHSNFHKILIFLIQICRKNKISNFDPPRRNPDFSRFSQNR